MPSEQRSRLVVLLALACAEPPAPRTAQPQALASAGASSGSQVERFLPLPANTVFSYSAWVPESAQPELLILQVERPSPSHANLRSGGSVKRLEFVSDGVRLITGGYLLKLPFQNGADWAGPAGRVRISAVDQEVEVAAGRFFGCLETTETDQRAAIPRSILTTYCPDVGIVKFSVDDGERQERFELKSFGPRVDVNDIQ
jgi:hypothetical protein